MNLDLRVVATFLVCFGTAALRAQAPPQSTDQWSAARKTGWQLVELVAEKLNGGPEFPGIEAWRKEFEGQTKGININIPPDQWPQVDIDALVTNNPNFWRAYFEIAPGDPGLAMLHAGLLLTTGEATRATDLILITGQRPGVPQQVRRVFGVIVNNSQKASEPSNALVQEGIALFDKGDFAAALEKHEEALAAWPQNGWAHYEYGLTLRQKQWKDSGEKVPDKGSVIVNSGPKSSKNVLAAFAKARHHDPFQLKAYQGDDKEVIAGFMALRAKGLPAWEQIKKAKESQVADEVLSKLAEACQETNQDELALATRQILVARRHSYAPADHPFITKSLKRLAPGKTTEATLERLAGGRLAFRQLMAPEPGTP